MNDILKDSLSEKQYQETKAFKFINNLNEVKTGFLYRVMFVGFAKENEKYDIIAECSNIFYDEYLNVTFKPVNIINKGKILDEMVAESWDINDLDFIEICEIGNINDYPEYLL